MSATRPIERDRSSFAGLTHREGKLADKAYVEIKRLLLDNRLSAGEYALEEDLAHATGMSRTPVREALLQLQNDGLITIVPRRGIRVNPLTPQDLHELYDILECLESQAARILALDGDRRARAAPLERLVAQMKDALDVGDLEGWAHHNDEFHVELIAASRNARLIRICGNLLDQSQRVRVVTLHLRSPPVATIDAHRRMLRAIAEGNPDEAARIQRENKRAWMQELEGILQRTKLRYL